MKDQVKSFALEEIKSSVWAHSDLGQIKVIVGLGNPGPKFISTRHNAGFILLDYLAQAFSASWKETKSWSVATIFHPEGGKLVLYKPLTFMNSSGVIVPELRKNGITPEECLVVHDELEKLPGQAVFRLGGSARGHNGLRSLIAAWGGNDNFWRLRVGIGRPENKADVADFVLSNFSAIEKAKLLEVAEKFTTLF